MTFSEFILDLRSTLQDMRKPDTSIIIDASEDGIRWTSSALQSIAKGAIVEMLRTFSALKLTQHINESIQYQLFDSKILPSGDITDLPPVFSRIVNIQDRNSVTYPFMEQLDFFDKFYITSPITDPVEGLNTDLVIGNFHTVIYNSATGKPVVKIVPAPSEELNCRLLVKIPLDNLYVLNNPNALPFVDCYDILRDYAELEARRREGNDTRSAQLIDTIKFKVSEIANELQRTNQQNQ